MKTILALTIVSLAILFGASSCAKNDQSKSADSGKPKIVATIGMIADAATIVGGDLIEVTGLMGAGVDPHLYRASARDIERLGAADLILYSGLHLESKMGEVFEKMQGKKTVAVSESIPTEKLLSSQQGQHDPHVWFDVSLWLYSVEAVKKALVELIPAQEAALTANYEMYKSKLQKLDAEVRQKAASIPQDLRVLVTAHDAFEYFGRAYGFEVRGLQGISTVSEAGSRDVQLLADFIAARKIPAIFVESSVPRKNVEALQAAVLSRGFEVVIGAELFSDAMGNAGTDEGTYIGMVSHNINSITGALGGSAAPKVEIK